MSRHEPIPRRTRGSRRVGAGGFCLLLLVCAGCFQIDDQGDDALAHLPWNPPPAVPPPVLPADAALATPPSAQDAAGPVVAPPADAGADAFLQPPVFGATDAGSSFAQDGGAGDGAAGVSDTGLPAAQPTAFDTTRESVEVNASALAVRVMRPSVMH